METLTVCFPMPARSPDPMGSTLMPSPRLSLDPAVVIGRMNLTITSNEYQAPGCLVDESPPRERLQAAAERSSGACAEGQRGAEEDRSGRREIPSTTPQNNDLRPVCGLASPRALGHASPVKLDPAPPQVGE